MASVESRDLISNILLIDSTKRLTIAQILTHPWFAAASSATNRDSVQSTISPLTSRPPSPTRDSGHRGGKFCSDVTGCLRRQREAVGRGYWSFFRCLRCVCPTSSICAPQLIITIIPFFIDLWWITPDLHCCHYAVRSQRSLVEIDLTREAYAIHSFILHARSSTTTSSPIYDLQRYID